MDLQQLKTFVMVAEEGHLTRAAERLYTSQPAVSAQLKSLEETLDIKLFERTPKGMLLTPPGQDLLRQARATLQAAQTMLDSAQALKGRVMGELSVGMNSDIDFLRLPQLIARARKQHPGVHISLMNSMSPDIITDVRKGKLDTGFFFGPCRFADLHITAVAEIDTAVVAPASWRDTIEHADLDALAAQPWVYTTERCPFYTLKEALFADCVSPPQQSRFCGHRGKHSQPDQSERRHFSVTRGGCRQSRTGRLGRALAWPHTENSISRRSATAAC